MLIPVKFTRTVEAGKGGKLHLRLADNIGTVTVDGKRVGEVSSLFGGGICVTVPSGDQWTATAEDFWNAVCAALGVDPSGQRPTTALGTPPERAAVEGGELEAPAAS